MDVLRCTTYYPDGSIYIDESRNDNVRNGPVLVYDRGVYYDVRDLPDYMDIDQIDPGDGVIAFLEYDESGLITVIAYNGDTGLSCLYGPNHVFYDLKTNNIAYISDDQNKHRTYTLFIIWYGELNKFKDITYTEKRYAPTRDFLTSMEFHKNGRLDKLCYEINVDDLLYCDYDGDYPFGISHISCHPSGQICEVGYAGFKYTFYECYTQLA